MKEVSVYADARYGIGRITVLVLCATNMFCAKQVKYVFLLCFSSNFTCENCTSASTRVQFSSAKLNELTQQQGMFCFDDSTTFYTNNSIMKNVDE